ncbi:hypothetical protein [Candidatus Amarobacter glycogenicus]|uniref:hypothetical protein n=1 Tax=Candidatus Amarobacter glycogenicus TaxID=3140699 RepID=UPI0031367D63|nr:hypothetical protein [Dehalococcoidia bacterium]
MFRVVVSVAAALFVPLVLAGCGDGPTPPQPTPTVDSTAGPVEGLPVLGPALQALEFAGVTTGAMSEANATCAWIHGTTAGSGRLQVTLDGMVDGARHRLRIIINGYDGPGVYEWDGAPGSGPEVSVDLDGQKGHALVVVAPTGDAGEIEAALSNPYQGRIHGIWQCPGVPR